MEEKRFERVCTGSPSHQFSTETANEEAACPECGAPAKSGLAIATPIEPFAEITDGADQWHMNVAALVSFLQQLLYIGISNWFVEHLIICHQATIGAAVARWLRKLRPLKWYESRVIPGFEELRVDLSLAERAQCADDMARLAGEIARNEDAKKAVVAHHKDIDEGLHKELNEVSRTVREGEFRRVAVDTIHDLQVGLCTRVRRDTGEVLSERPLTGKERQGVLDLGNAGPKPATADDGKKGKAKKHSPANGKARPEKKAKTPKKKPPKKGNDAGGDEARP